MILQQRFSFKKQTQEPKKIPLSWKNMNISYIVYFSFIFIIFTIKKISLMLHKKGEKWWGRKKECVIKEQKLNSIHMLIYMLRLIMLIH